MMFSSDVPEKEARLQRKDAFRFECRPDLACFNRCCRKKRIVLTPYDLLRLKQALNIHSDEFLTRYTVLEFAGEAGFPVLSLKMDDGGEKACPFVSSRGCEVYAHRPSACRLYPLGRATRKRPSEQPGLEEFFFMLKTQDCRGILQDRTRPISTWVEEQGLEPYLEMNDLALSLSSHSGLDRGRALGERQLQKIMVACYNLDIFREFVFKTDFSRVFEIDDTTLALVGVDDEALLRLGFSYLQRTLQA
jgi:Fe-S-cluster containining protein